MAKQYQPITPDEARGNSRPVTAQHFQKLARAGEQMVKGAAKNNSTAGLDKDWEGTKDRAYALAKEPWGGATINSHTGNFAGDTAETVASKVGAKTNFGRNQNYAITAKQPGQHTIEAPTNLNREQFGQHMDRARAAFPRRGHEGMHLGVFHDADKGTIDIDPVRVVKNPRDVERIGAYTHAIGGAYHMESGNGYFPPHVSPKAKDK
jgi:hypothetical protein